MRNKHILIIAVTTVILALGQTPAPVAPTHPSNGVLELSAKPTPGPDPHPASKRVEQYVAWHGNVEITLRNVSFGYATVEDAGWDYDFEVFDSSGRPVERTDLGKRVAALHKDSSPQAFSSGGLGRLAPLQTIVEKRNLADYFKIGPSRAYTVTIRRSRGLPKIDEYQKPIKDVEVSCSFDVPDFGIPRSTRR
jgi:hypothetical protein